MPKELIVNATLPEIRVAYLEDGEITDFSIERTHDRGVVGNIYKGKVLRVLPGMQACFVDVGLEKAAFLYVDDVLTDTIKPEVELVEDEKEAEEEDYRMEEVEKKAFESIGEADEDDIEATREDRSKKEIETVEKDPVVRATPKGAKIEDLVKEGDILLVQVAKGPISSKGARLTCHISLPGRNLVFMPTIDHIGVSRKIASYDERKRLRHKINSLRPEGTGFIVRTACEGLTDEKLEQDVSYLVSLWQEIKQNLESAKPGSLVHEELNAVLRSVRDVLTEDVNRVVIDNETLCQQVMRFVNRHMPHFKDKIYPYDGPEPIFEAYGIDLEIRRALERQVWLPSGGYLIIDQTEALVTIDVNTGKFVGQKNLEETITQTNAEAVREIAYQLRLRNCGGIIIIDLIDMERTENKRKVFQALEEALKKDKSRVNILKISDFGLIEMTRKRTRDTLVRSMCEPCFYCEGKGYLRNKETLSYDVLRQAYRDAPKTKEKALFIYTHPAVTENLQKNERDSIEMIEKRFNKQIHLKADPNYHFEQFEIFCS